MWTTASISNFLEPTTIPTGISVSSLPWLRPSASGWAIVVRDFPIPSRSQRMLAVITLSAPLVPTTASTSGSGVSTRKTVSSVLMNLRRGRLPHSTPPSTCPRLYGFVPSTSMDTTCSTGGATRRLRPTTSLSSSVAPQARCSWVPLGISPHSTIPTSRMRSL